MTDAPYNVVPIKKIHPSHKMTRWRSTIISTPNADRFGEIRTCRKCGAEQAKTVAGGGTHEELWKPCRA